MTNAAELEQRDPTLRSALTQLAEERTADHLCAVAEAYNAAGVLDTAYDRASEALRLNAGSARAFDLRARIWRRWGMPGRGLGDAYRSVYLAPHSPEAHNTLGTLLEALGNGSDALAEYERALRLDPSATYARANLERVRVRGANGSPR